MPGAEVTWDELAKGVTRAACERHELLVRRTYAHVITLDRVAFQPSSPVLLPVPKKIRRENGGVVTGLSLLAQALRYAAEHSDQTLSVLGHARVLGSTDAELCLYKLRAQHVLAYLEGDRDAFADSCAAHTAEDERRIQEWAKRAYGTAWPASTLCTLDDFRTLFDLYDRHIAELLGESDLRGARGKLKLGDPKSLACGAFWPRDGGYREPSGTGPVVLREAGANDADSRVDLLFAEPDVRLPAQPQSEAPGARIYLDKRYVLRTPIAPEPEPVAVCVRMSGMYFDSNKCFLLPSATPGLRKLVQLYQDHPSGELLIVGHTDTSGEPAYNDALSLERAKAVAAYLSDDVDAWLAWYETSKPAKKRWGASEDMAMLGALPDGAAHTAAKDPIKSYQASRGLDVDGVAGKNTRTKLIGEYMALDGTSLPASLEPVAHGCGESFPIVQTGDHVDHAENRRVELILFDQKVEPAPSGEISKPGSEEYGKWQRKVVQRHDLSASGQLGYVRVRLCSAFGVALTGVACELRGESGESQSGVTDASGDVLFTYVPLDIYQLTARAGAGALTLSVPWLESPDEPHVVSCLGLLQVVGTETHAAAVQLRLLAFGKQVPQTGEVDSDTRAAIKHVQTSLGLPADGECSAELGRCLASTFGA